MSLPIPLEDRVAILQSEAKKQTAGGLAIPDTAQRKPAEGEIVAVGPGRPGKDTAIGYLVNDVFFQSIDGMEITMRDRIVPVYSMPAKVGDLVYFSFYAGVEIEHEGKTYLIMRISDLISRK